MANKDIALDNGYLYVSVFKTARISIDNAKLYQNHIYSEYESSDVGDEEFLFYERADVTDSVPIIKVRILADGSIEFYEDGKREVTVNKFIPKIPNPSIEYADVLARNRFGQPMIMDDQNDLRTVLEFPGRSYTWITDPVKTMKKYEYADPQNGNYNIILKDVPCRYRVMNVGLFGVPEAQIIGYGRPDELKTKYDYTDRYEVSKITDPNQLKAEMEYDGFGRLIEKKINNKTVSSYDYSYWNSSQSNLNLSHFDDRSDFNFTESRTHFDDSTAIVLRSYSDPLGREFSQFQKSSRLRKWSFH
mgnify:CR=1 FL=1